MFYFEKQKRSRKGNGAFRFSCNSNFTLKAKDVPGTAQRDYECLSRGWTPCWSEKCSFLLECLIGQSGSFLAKISNQNFKIDYFKPKNDNTFKTDHSRQTRSKKPTTLKVRRAGWCSVGTVNSNVCLFKFWGFPFVGLGEKKAQKQTRASALDSHNGKEPRFLEISFLLGLRCFGVFKSSQST